MRALLIGASGQLGSELVGPLSTFTELTALRDGDLDITDLDRLREFVREARPNAIVNAAAYTDVDGAEREPIVAMRVNRDAVSCLGELCRDLHAGLVHVSTDFVFDGEAQRPYVETDPTNPLNQYGLSKLEGERVLESVSAPAIVFRTAWVYSLRRKSFVSSILAAARARESLRVVDDQIGNPTFARDLAIAIALVLHGVRGRPFEAISHARGVYHLAGGGAVSRFELARAAIELDPRREEHKVREVVPVPSTEYPLPARRPMRGALDCSKAQAVFGVSLPPWREALARALAG
jgi:dTDP-4-dehydrorhamnose reductase